MASWTLAGEVAAAGKWQRAAEASHWHPVTCLERPLGPRLAGEVQDLDGNYSAEWHWHRRRYWDSEKGIGDRSECHRWAHSWDERKASPGEEGAEGGP